MIWGDYISAVLHHHPPPTCLPQSEWVIEASPALFRAGPSDGVTVGALLGQHIAHSPVFDTVTCHFFLLEGLIGVAAHSRYATSIERWLALRKDVHPQKVGDLYLQTCSRVLACDAEGSRVGSELMQQNQPRLGVCWYLTVFSRTCPSHRHFTDTLLRSMSNGWFEILVP